MQRSLDGFTVLELVGFGGSGEVWRARPDGGGPYVALKWLTDETVDTESLTSDAMREFEHPHVARLLEVRQDRAGVVLVEEYVSGGSLATLLTERDRLGCAEVVTLLTPVAEALGAAHEAGLVHANLTPASILFTPDGRPMVTDLGVWPALCSRTRPAPRPEYLDPAVARGGPSNESSDVFALAAIGFHALTGRPPWTAGSAAASWQLSADGDGVDLSPLHSGGLPPQLAEVIARGLSERPRRRGSARDFAADVRDALEPEPLHLTGPFVWPDLPPLPEESGIAEPVDLGESGNWDTERLDLGATDIAGAVRGAGSPRGNVSRRARPAPTPGARSARTFGTHLASRLRAGATVVPRPAVVGAFVALAILTLVVLSIGWNASKAQPVRAAAPIGATSTDAGAVESASGIDERAVPDSPAAWLAFLSLLYERRAAAFGTGAPLLLDQVFSADSPQLIADTTELTRLETAGQVLRGFAPRVVEVLEAVVVGDRARLRITDEFAGYETVPAEDVRGAALTANPGRGPTTVSMTLVLTEEGWRIDTAHRLG